MTPSRLAEARPVIGEIEFGDDPTFLYRLYDKEGHLLYVGITFNLRTRMRDHARDQEWWPQVARRTMICYATREEASRAETEAIKTEHPRHNTQQQSNSRTVYLKDRGPGEWVYCPPGARLFVQERSGQLRPVAEWIAENPPTLKRPPAPEP
jgi:predicted GIY-YIG superfamily endonuclease